MDGFGRLDKLVGGMHPESVQVLLEQVRAVEELCGLANKKWVELLKFDVMMGGQVAVEGFELDDSS